MKRTINRLALATLLVCAMLLAACGQKAENIVPAQSAISDPAVTEQIPVPNSTLPELEPSTEAQGGLNGDSAVVGTSDADIEEQQFEGKGAQVVQPSAQVTEDIQQETTGSDNLKIVTRHEDGKSYDQYGNRFMTPGDVDYEPTLEEQEASRALILSKVSDILNAGLHPYDYNFYVTASDTGRRVSREEYDSFIQAGKDPIEDDYLDSEHEAGLY